MLLRASDLTWRSDSLLRTSASQLLEEKHDATERRIKGSLKLFIRSRIFESLPFEELSSALWARDFITMVYDSRNNR